jgi:flagellar protein FlgJ
MTIDGVGASTGAAASTAAAAQKAKLTDAAQQFEAMLLQEMLKPMQSGLTGEDGDGEGALSGSGSTLSSFGTESVARAIAKAGGLGIAKRVVEQVSRESKIKS